MAVFGAQAAAPVVSNVRAAQRSGTQVVDITYDLADPDTSALKVSVAISTNGGAAWFSPGASVSGAVGTGIAPGSGKSVAWNARVDLPAKLFSNMRVSITASDDTAPGGMALIPAGSFTMGNCMSASEAYSGELPLHTVYVSAFYMDKYDVTKALWDTVYQWATSHGYAFESGALGKAANHPAQSMTWYEAVKWCNARSQQGGLTPCYYTDAGLTVVYKSGEMEPYVSWAAGGYRLPTEAEWEKAARGGAGGQRFPWGNTISWSQANYAALPLSAGGYAYDVNPTSGYHPTFNDGVYPSTSPVGYFGENGYGLYDMAGNVWQWCWDWYGSYSSVSQTDPRGPTSGSLRVIRGGDWFHDARGCRAAIRGNRNPTDGNGLMGFRCARAAGQ
ncbi:MAG: formylglycine-generating enzyme family protein [Verrucomicrobia bacterium]|nr:formylglycine-generating enzyme family protein [Verrucomicrobiota bacterium]